MKEKLQIYIKNNLEKDNFLISRTLKKASNIFQEACYECEYNNVQDYIIENKTETNFQKLLFEHIDKRGLKDSDVYNKVHIDRRLFSKIRSDNNYHPSKETVILLGLSLELSEKEIEALLESASYSLPKNNLFDLIIRFCFIEEIYNIFDINILLDEHKCKLLDY